MVLISCAGAAHAADITMMSRDAKIERINAVTRVLNEQAPGQDELTRTLVSRTIEILGNTIEKTKPRSRTLIFDMEGRDHLGLIKTYATTLGLPVRIIDLNNYTTGAYEGYSVLAEIAAIIKDQPETVLVFKNIDRAHPRTQIEIGSILSHGQYHLPVKTGKKYRSELIDSHKALMFFTLSPEGFSVEEARRGVGFTAKWENEENKRVEIRLPPDILRSLDDVLMIKPLSPEKFRQLAKSKVEAMVSELASEGIRVNAQSVLNFVDQFALQAYRPGSTGEEIGQMLTELRRGLAHSRIKFDVAHDAEFILALRGTSAQFVPAEHINSLETAKAPLGLPNKSSCVGLFK